MGIGIALAERAKNQTGRVYVILGDGESQEGQVWEAVMAAANFGLNRLTAIVDHNKLQATGAIGSRMEVGSLPEKWKAFGWNVCEVDGHDIAQLSAAFDQAEQYTQGPTVIIAHTIKGKGVSFMENVAKYHNGALTEAEYQQVLAELA